MGSTPARHTILKLPEILERNEISGSFCFPGSGVLRRGAAAQKTSSWWNCAVEAWGGRWVCFKTTQNNLENNLRQPVNAGISRNVDEICWELFFELFELFFYGFSFRAESAVGGVNADFQEGLSGARPTRSMERAAP